MAFNKPETFEEIVEAIDELAAMIDPKRREPISWGLTNQVKRLHAWKETEDKIANGIR